MSVISDSVKAIAPYIAVGGLAYAVIKSGILGKGYENLKQQFGYGLEQTKNTINETVQNITSVIYTERIVYDENGEKIDLSNPKVTLRSDIPDERWIPANIPQTLNKTQKQYDMTILGPAKTTEELLGQPKPTVIGGREIAWWDPFGWVAGLADTVDYANMRVGNALGTIKNPFVASAANLNFSQGTHTDQNMTTAANLDPIQGTNSQQTMIRIENERNLAEANSKGSDPMEYLSNEYSAKSNPESWPTPYESTLPFYGSPEVEKALTGETSVTQPKEPKQETHEITPAERERGYVGH